MTSLFSSRALRIGITTAALVACAMPVQASASPASGTTEHSFFDPVGAVFTCNSREITVTAGTVDQVMHFGQDSSGGSHFTGTLTAHDIAAQDANGAQYTITGASHVAGKLAADTLQLVTDSSHFVIHETAGGVYGKVQLVDHYNVTGRSFTLDFGGCEAPNG
jgi:hypothetical protein